MSFAREFPALLKELHQLEFDYADGDGMDFEPYDQFHPAEENADWIRCWTGNPELTGEEYRIFGQDGTGGYAAFWLVRHGKSILEQPIVFFDSEGDLGVVARNFQDYLWLLAGGVGPYEAIHGYKRGPVERFTEFAMKHAASAKKTPGDVLAAARAEFPKFEEDVRALCK
jgi:hypothetical protein